MPDTKIETQAPTVSVSFFNRQIDSLPAVASALTVMDSLWDTCYLLAEWNIDPPAATRRAQGLPTGSAPNPAENVAARKPTAYVASRLMVAKSENTDRTLSFLREVAQSFGWSTELEPEDPRSRSLALGVRQIRLTADEHAVVAPDAWRLLQQARVQAGDDQTLLRGVGLDHVMVGHQTPEPVPQSTPLATTPLAGAGGPAVPKPARLRLRKGSPLWVELGGDVAGHTAVASLAFGIVVACVKNPRRIAGFLPGLVEGWHRGWADAERAKRDHQEMLELANYGDRLARELALLEPGDVDVDGDVTDVEAPNFSP